MIDPWNRVMNNLLIAEEGVCKSIVSNTTSTPPVFPALAVEAIANADAAVDLENTENGVDSRIRIRSYSVNGISEARNVISVACDAMRQMGYERTYGPQPVTFLTDFNIRVMEARFRRFVGDVDTDIPSFDTE